MKTKNTFVQVLTACVVLGVLISTARADYSCYEIAGGTGISLNDLGSTEGILLGAWIKRLSNTVELRVEPNIEFIAPRSGHSLVFGGVSPVFRFGIHGQSLNPFLDAGVGVSVSSSTTVFRRDFGGNFFFSPTAGIGIKLGSPDTGFSFFARWIHHSNAGLFPPNEGIDSLYLLLGYRF